MQDLPVNDLLTVAQAIDILDATPIQPRVIQLPLLEAMDLYLAQDFFADRDYPPFDKSVMDGFAIRSADASEAGARLLVIQTIAAGQVGRRPIGSGEAAAIMTGAPLPPGADCVVPVERTARDGNIVVIQQPAKAGQSIAKQGTDTRAGQLVLSKGNQLGPAQIAVAASLGLNTISVYARPMVAVISTGDELIEIDQTPVGSQIRNANGPMLQALLKRLGCDVIHLGMVPDQREALRSAIGQGLQSDALFITGGMSMGERDYVPGLLKEMGLELKISKLRIKPGKPFAFAVGDRPAGEKHRNPFLVFGLPGNPVSAFVCAMCLARRIICRLGGGKGDLPLETAQINVEMVANGPREFYIPGWYHGQIIQPVPFNGSADLFSLSQANSLILRSENAPIARFGDLVQFIKI